jgi:hypothetical protein
MDLRVRKARSKDLREMDYQDIIEEFFMLYND